MKAPQAGAKISSDCKYLGFDVTVCLIYQLSFDVQQEQFQLSLQAHIVPCSFLI